MTQTPAGDRVVVVVAADENYAMPLAVTIRSAIDHLADDLAIELLILDAGITDATRDRLIQSWPRDRVETEFVAPAESDLSGLPISDHISVATYFRMLIPRLLPDGIEKAIYLDSDLLVLDDLATLWRREFGDELLHAAPDVACPFFDCEKSLENYLQCAPWLVTARPIPNYKTLGFSGSEPYFNGGVLLLNVGAWRREDTTSAMFACIEANRESLLFWDQYALNVTLAGKWKSLPARWNQGAHLLDFPTATRSSLSPAEHEESIENPAIVHFTSPTKPWHWSSTHPHTKAFVETIDRTDWRGWRPEREWGSMLKKWRLKSLVGIQRMGRKLSLATGAKWIGQLVGM